MKHAFWLIVAVSSLYADPAGDLLSAYTKQGASPNAQAGAAAWTEKHIVGGETRSCASCHGTNVRQAGSHKETGETIQPLAPSVNPERLTDPEFVEKWFTRNCKWTFGRSCSVQEKANFLAFLRNQ